MDIMWKGEVVAIYITPEQGERVVPREEVRAVPGKGLEGDRYYRQALEHPEKIKPDQQLTFVEIEALEALQAEQGIDLTHGETRRNIVTRGVPLNHLVGHTFQVGEVTVRGLRLCEPCTYLENHTAPGVLRALLHRAGLRAEVLTGGLIRVGDVMKEV
jgi:MOSC domain-containing protein YiiM